MDEAGLLADALKQLDEPFLVVVVGEFNSGKSSVINALLGGPFLAQGILPTTNEIAVLRYRCSAHSHALPLCCKCLSCMPGRLHLAAPHAQIDSPMPILKSSACPCTGRVTEKSW